MIPEKLSSCKFYLCGSSSTTERFALFEEKGGVVTVPRQGTLKEGIPFNHGLLVNILNNYVGLIIL